MIRTSIKLSVLVTIIAIIGCGGGSSDSSSGTDSSSGASAQAEPTETTNSLVEPSTPISPQSTMSKITGTVPGTLIEAFCIDGSYYRTTSEQNGGKEHPFTLTIPQKLECHLVMTTNENDPLTKVVTPIAINNNDQNHTSFSINGETLELGYIDLALSPSDIEDINGDQVVDKPLPVTPKQGTVKTTPPIEDSMDSDNDGIIDLFEDDDSDGISNRDDTDANNDGIEDDRQEAQNQEAQNENEQNENEVHESNEQNDDKNEAQNDNDRGLNEGREANEQNDDENEND
jgi:hypothetical protein